jgi:hypothetical protein
VSVEAKVAVPVALRLPPMRTLPVKKAAVPVTAPVRVKPANVGVEPLAAHVDVEMTPAAEIARHGAPAEARPVIVRFVVVTLPVTKTGPEKTEPSPARPIVMPVAEVPPIVIVPVASKFVPVSPMILVPEKVRAAEAIETLAKTKNRETTKINIFFIYLFIILVIL